jgi:Rrf2 family protein
MRLSKRGEYALRALIDLGMAQELGRPMLQIAELSKRGDIPIKFLQQILVQLKEAGYLDSKRGRLGGSFSKSR